MARAQAVLFLNRTQLQIYGSGVSGVVGVTLPSKVYMDLAVLDREALTNFLVEFIVKYKLPAQEAVMVMAESVCFSQEIPPEVVGVKREELVTNFTTTVPFEMVTTKVFGGRMIAVNKRLADAVKQAFEQKGFEVTELFPAALFSEIGVKENLEAKAARDVLAKAERTGGFWTETEEEEKDNKKEKTEEVEAEDTAGQKKAKKSNKMPLLLAVFVILILILGILILVRLRSPS